MKITIKKARIFPERQNKRGIILNIRIDTIDGSVDLETLIKSVDAEIAQRVYNLVEEQELEEPEWIREMWILIARYEHQRQQLSELITQAGEYERESGVYNGWIVERSTLRSVIDDLKYRLVKR